MNDGTQVYTTTYLGADTWDNGVPELNVAESAFITIPEPTVFALLGLSSLMMIVARPRR